jgi:hypothetical protein
MEGSVEIIGIEIPFIFVIMIGLALGSTAIGVWYMHAPSVIEKMSKPLIDIIGFCTILAIALDGIIILAVVFVTGFFTIRFLYQTTVGRPTVISYLMTNGEVVQATYPWYKAVAIRLSLCKIYEV